MADDLKFKFIQQVLGDYLVDVKHTMSGVIRNKAFHTGALLQSLDTRLRPAGADIVGELIFNEYGRMLDMGVGRGHPLGGLRATRIALQGSNTIGMAKTKDKTIKRKLIYSKIAYGKLNYLENQLLYGYTQETFEGLKQELNKANP